MANWIKVDEGEFHAHISELRTEKRVYNEYIPADHVRIYWVGDTRYFSPLADWIAKIELINKKSHYYIAEQ